MFIRKESETAPTSGTVFDRTTDGTVPGTTDVNGNCIAVWFNADTEQSDPKLFNGWAAAFVVTAGKGIAIPAMSK